VVNALTIRQPYASLIIRGIKTIECRNWKLPLGKLVIHAAAGRPPKFPCLLGCTAPLTLTRAEIESMPRGVVLGTVHVVAHERIETPAPYKWANVLEAPQPLPEPVPAKGRQSIWQWSEGGDS